MNTRILVVFFCFFASSLNAQVLRDMNFSQVYSPTEEYAFNFRVIKLNEGFKVFYRFALADTTQNRNVVIQFETRESLGDKSGTAVSSPLSQLQGAFDFTADSNHKILVAVISNDRQEKPKKIIYHEPLPAKKSPFVFTSTGGLIKSYVIGNEILKFGGTEGALLISYYGTPFPPAAPAFSTSQSKVAKTIRPDSIFSASESTPLTLTKRGLYLAQTDTASAEGFAFRVEEDYPKLATIQSLAGPLIYICTNQENEKLKQAGNDKKKFDQVILSITGNSERARSFMRSFYRRVEYANILFTSYKEGWKTDRGMIYIIFGPPDEVYLFDDREIWEYKDEVNRNRFQFLKSPTLFDPENFVLIRDRKYTTNWYKTVDLWRKARF